MAASTVIVLASKFAAPVVESIKLSRSIVCTPIVLSSTETLSNCVPVIFVTVSITEFAAPYAASFVWAAPNKRSWRSVRVAFPNEVSFA